ncbi:MAG: hypothetical protein NWS71_01255 [Opitutales bacterium]|nr:hypothetical protein [Opitutales bacterium]
MKQYFFILGHPFTKQSVFITVTLMIIMVAAIVSSSYFVITDKPEPTQATAPADPAPKTEESPQTVNPDSLVDILAMHIKATGFDTLKNFTMRGTPLHDSEQRAVSVKGLHPNLYKFTVNYLETKNSVEFGHNGEETWMESSWSNRSFPNEDTDKSVILILSSMPHLAWTYNSAKSSLEPIGIYLSLEPEQIHNGRNCYVIRSRKILPFEMDHFIDAETFYEIYRTATLQKADGSTLEIGVEYDQEKIDKGSRFSLFHEVYENGKLIDELVYESPRTNITLMSSLFAPPSEYGR